MKGIRYFYLQLKRAGKLLPMVLGILAVLGIGLALVLGGMLQSDSEDADKQKLRIGVVGDADNRYFEMGLTALTTLDSTRFAIEVEQMDETTARQALERGELSTYVVIPEGFIEDALRGKIGKIRYVSTGGAVGVVSMFKDEVTKVISQLLLHSQKGVYALGEVLTENGDADIAHQQLNRLNIEYIGFILKRHQLYEVTEIGVGDGLSTPGYFLCGISVLFLLLMGMACAPLFLKKDRSLHRMLSAKGCGAAKQSLWEYLAYLVLLLLMVALFLAALLAVAENVSGMEEIIPELDGWDLSRWSELFLKLTLPVAMIGAMHFVLYELTSGVVSSILLQLLSSLAMGYVSGCLYPAYFFPEAIQSIATWLPAGIARSYMAGCLQGDVPDSVMWKSLLYLGIFIGWTVWLRRRKIRGEVH